MARVLVVDNDPATRRLLAWHLESENHEVITAEDGEQGLQKAVETAPDLIVSDIRIPVIDGIGMLARLRSDPRTSGIPFIFLTDSDDGQLRARSRALRVAEYLVKPFDRERLLSAVSSQTCELAGAMAGGDDSSLMMTAQLEALAVETDHMATIAMAPEYASVLPGVNPPVRYPNPGNFGAARAAQNGTTERVVEGTVAFFAIRDFAQIAEDLGDDVQIELINAFHAKMRDVVEAHSGWIVKTIMGGFIAMFEEDPAQDAGHAERGAKTAVLCVLALNRFSAWIAHNRPKGSVPALAAVAGLHSGQVSICSLVGGKAGTRSERTIIGDTVNVAARLQTRAGELGWSIVCSDSTMQLAGLRFGKGREGRIEVKGRQAPLSIAEITSLKPKSGGDGGDTSFYVDVTSALSTNTRLIAAQNAIRAPQPAPPVAVPEAAAVAPIVIDGYQVVRKIGEGGVAQVYLARHLGSGEERVLKLVRLSAEYANEAAKRFVQEYALLMQGAHQNVARVYQHGHEGEYAYMAMEYFPGGDLRKLMREACSPSMAVAALIQIASGISEVHRMGVVHRDLKPDNIMIRQDGSLAIADFGIAKKVADDHGPTQHGDILGTPYYLSPEQVLGIPADHRADIYSLGVMFYEMLTGERAYVAETVMGLMQQHAHAPVPVLKAPLERYQPLLERMMNKDKHRRFGGASEIVDFVEHYQLA